MSAQWTPQSGSVFGPNVRRYILVGLILLAVLVAYGQLRRPETPASTAPDWDLKAAMLGNIADAYGDADWYPLLLTDGSRLDIAVKDRLLIVATVLPQSDTEQASRICSSIAAITNDGDTSKPLGISGVVVISGGEQLADCRP